MLGFGELVDLLRLFCDILAGGGGCWSVVLESPVWANAMGAETSQSTVQSPPMTLNAR